MHGRRRELVVVLAVLACAAAVEIVALRSQTLGLILLGTAGGLAAVVVLAGADLVRIGMGASLLSAFTMSWNGWYVGPVRPGDALIPIALICFAAGAPITVFRAPPWWVKQLVIALVLGVLLIVLLPPDQYYLTHRVVLDAGGRPVSDKITGLPLTNIGVAAKFVIATAAIPIAYTATAVVDRRAIRWLAIAFAAGTSLSGLVAFLDHTGLTSLSKLITRLPASVSASGRAAGFTTHPNFLAAGVVLAVPFACWLTTSRVKWEQRLGLISLAGDLLGAYASGSRGGAVCAVGAVLLAFALLPRTRPHVPGIVLGGVLAAGLIVVAFPSLGMTILRVTRLAGNTNTAGSDEVRAAVGAQGLADFHYSPFHGIGLQVSTEASEVYLQELASGGLILFLAMSAYMLGAAWDSARLIREDALAAAVLGAIGATLALNVFEADLTDRFYYVPEAILVAMLITRRLATSHDLPAPAPAAVRADAPA